MNQDDNSSGKSLVLLAKSISPSLGTKEQMVTEFIAENWREVSNTNIKELSKRLKVSEATIIKVCKRLNCDGFYMLKQKLHDYLLKNEQVIEDFNINDTPEEILKKVFNQAIAALQNTLTILDLKSFNQAVLAVNNARKILFIGLGGSGSIAADACHKFLKVGMMANYYTDTNLQLMAASLLTEGDVVIGISHSGQSKSVINAMKLAQKNGAKTVCITNYIRSPITDVSDISLVSSALNSPLTGENASARIVSLSILDALYMAVVLRHFDDSMTNLEKTRKSVISSRYKIRRKYEKK